MEKLNKFTVLPFTVLISKIYFENIQNLAVIESKERTEGGSLFKPPMELTVPRSNHESQGSTWYYGSSDILSNSAWQIM